MKPFLGFFCSLQSQLFQLEELLRHTRRHRFNVNGDSSPPDDDDDNDNDKESDGNDGESPETMEPEHHNEPQLPPPNPKSSQVAKYFDEGGG